MMPINVKVKIEDERLGKEFPLPKFETDGASAIDLRAMIEQPLLIVPGQRELISTGIRVELPEQVGMFILPRSGLGAKKGLVIGNLVGLIDSDYRGIVYMSIWNTGSEDYTVEVGERVAQACFMPTLKATFEYVDDLSDTRRASGGFGHTGK